MKRLGYLLLFAFLASGAAAHGGTQAAICGIGAGLWLAAWIYGDDE
jgi:hypothetical protein